MQRPRVGKKVAWGLAWLGSVLIAATVAHSQGADEKKGQKIYIAGHYAGAVIRDAQNRPYVPMYPLLTALRASFDEEKSRATANAILYVDPPGSDAIKPGPGIPLDDLASIRWPVEDTKSGLCYQLAGFKNGKGDVDGGVRLAFTSVNQLHSGDKGPKSATVPIRMLAFDEEGKLIGSAQDTVTVDYTIIMNIEIPSINGETRASDKGSVIGWQEVKPVMKDSLVLSREDLPRLRFIKVEVDKPASSDKPADK